MIKFLFMVATSDHIRAYQSILEWDKMWSLIMLIWIIFHVFFVSITSSFMVKALVNNKMCKHHVQSVFYIYLQLATTILSMGKCKKDLTSVH